MDGIVIELCLWDTLSRDGGRQAREGFCLAIAPAAATFTGSVRVNYTVRKVTFGQYRFALDFSMVSGKRKMTNGRPCCEHAAVFAASKSLGRR